MNEKLALNDDILMKIEKPARYIGPIWAFRSCTACSTPGTMSGVRESILPGWI